MNFVHQLFVVEESLDKIESAIVVCCLFKSWKMKTDFVIFSRVEEIHVKFYKSIQLSFLFKINSTFISRADIPHASSIIDIIGFYTTILNFAVNIDRRKLKIRNRIR